MVHISFAVLLLLTIMASELLPKTAVIDLIFTTAAYTYGPLLGLFVFGLFTKMRTRDHLVPVISLVSVGCTFLLNYFSVEILGGYKFGYELLLVNGMITFCGLAIFSSSPQRLENSTVNS